MLRYLEKKNALKFYLKTFYDYFSNGKNNLL